MFDAWVRKMYDVRVLSFCLFVKNVFCQNGMMACLAISLLQLGRNGRRLRNKGCFKDVCRKMDE